MGDETSQSVDFLGSNIIVIGIVFLAIFGYLLLLIRKRWKHNFLHEPDDRGKKK